MQKWRLLLLQPEPVTTFGLETLEVTLYSCDHVSLNPWRNEKKFWDFDWAEMGMYDIPASFDYITALTGHPKVAYIGHSQGTTQMFYGLAENESYYKDKMSIFVALAPVTMLPNT